MAKGIFVTCAHSVAEQLDGPGHSIHFRRDRICVEGEAAEVILMGNPTSWNCDLALLQMQDPELDLGPVTAIKGERLDRYKVITVFPFLILECVFRAVSGLRFLLI